MNKQARIGCKGNNTYWYSYKKHVIVDMQNGLINKIAIISANITDAQGMKHICLASSTIYADKGYCTTSASKADAKKSCHLRVIKTNNMHGKNKDQDCGLSDIRSSYERVFANQNKRVRYRGVAKD